MSTDPVYWLDGELTADAPTDPPAGPADPTPWGEDSLTDSPALPGDPEEEGGEPPPVPPTDPTPWPTASLVAGTGSCCCPLPPVVCYCPPANTVCVTTAGFPVPSLGAAGEPLLVNGSWTYTYGTYGFPAFYVGWFPTPFTSTLATSGASGCAGAGPAGPPPPPPQPAVLEYIDYGPAYNGTGYPNASSPVLSCAQRDELGGSASYTYFNGQYGIRRDTVTACQDNRFPGSPPTFGLSYDWNLELDVLFAGWGPADLAYNPGPGFPGAGGAGGWYSAPPGGRPPAPTVVSCTADEMVLTVPWTRWRYKEEGIRTRTAFLSPGPAAHNGTVTLNELTSGTATVTIARGACLVDGPEGEGGGGEGFMAVAPRAHPDAERLAAADPLLRPGCCG